jgi:hypothetical protein
MRARRLSLYSRSTGCGKPALAFPMRNVALNPRLIAARGCGRIATLLQNRRRKMHSKLAIDGWPTYQLDKEFRIFRLTALVMKCSESKSFYNCGSARDRMDMASEGKSALRSGISAALLYAGAAALVAVPSAGFALGVLDGKGIRQGFGSFTPASVDPRLARLVSATSGAGTLMRFTPAGASNRPGRSITVAVRVDEATAQLVSVRSALAAAGDQSSDTSIRIAPTRYNLGVARGYQSFANTPAVVSGLAKDLGSAAMPDLAKFAPSPGAKSKPSRFAARIALEEQQNAGRAPRTLESLGDQTVDLAGSYRLTRNIDVTAGLRYSQDRDRLAPLTNGKQDSQAVYVGTQFRF